MKHQKTIVWFRKDLRIHDNPALMEAVEDGVVIPVFIWSPEEETHGHKKGAASWWLYQSLRLFTEMLEKVGVKLILRKGNALAQLLTIAKEVGADALYFNQRYEPGIVKRDQRIVDAIRHQNMTVRTFHSHVLYEPLSITSKQNSPYKVYTPFYKQCLKKGVTRPLGAPSRITCFQGAVKSLKLVELDLLSSSRSHEKFTAYWQPGETSARKQWEIFFEKTLNTYSANRDIPSLSQTSRLSPHLAWGEISPRWIWCNLKEKLTYVDEIGSNSKAEIEGFMKQLAWREFAYHQMVAYPEAITLPIRSEFRSFPWLGDEVTFQKWKEGRTGYPFIDAGMRELWETGAMHNRVRMVAASFLVKQLLIPWQWGAAWFEETLLDFDVANNTMGWQWVAGSGFDAAPYFRVFNPIVQGERFDKNGVYVKKWIPELALLPEKYLHRPWTAPSDVLEKAQITLGKSYPLPMIDHGDARNRALRAYDMIKK